MLFQRNGNSTDSPVPHAVSLLVAVVAADFWATKEYEEGLEASARRFHGGVPKRLTRADRDDCIFRDEPLITGFGGRLGNMVGK